MGLRQGGVKKKVSGSLLRPWSIEKVFIVAVIFSDIEASALLPEFTLILRNFIMSGTLIMLLWAQSQAETRLLSCTVSFLIVPIPYSLIWSCSSLHSQYRQTVGKLRQERSNNMQSNTVIYWQHWGQALLFLIISLGTETCCKSFSWEQLEIPVKSSVYLASLILVSFLVAWHITSRCCGVLVCICLAVLPFISITLFSGYLWHVRVEVDLQPPCCLQSVAMYLEISLLLLWLFKILPCFIICH